MNPCLLIIATSSLLTFSVPITVEAQSHDSKKSAPLVSPPPQAPEATPSVNLPPLPPTSPSGPRWKPIPGETYRLELEQYRLNLEAFRKNNGTNDTKTYLQGIEKYRNEINLYKESVQSAPNSTQR